MGFAYLARYYLKRTLRHRTLVLAGLALPLIGGVTGIALPGANARLVCAWACPAACAMLVFGWIWLLGQMDRVGGLTDGIRSTPLSSNVIMASRVAAGAALLAAQMTVFAAVLVLIH